MADHRTVTVLSAPSDRLSAIFDRLGGVVVAQSLQELDAFAVLTALMGTFYGLQEVATDWMEGQGVAAPDAQRFLSGLFLALARTTQESGKTYPELREAHSTPGGLNAQLFEVFDQSGGSEALRRAMGDVLARVQAAR